MTRELKEVLDKIREHLLYKRELKLTPKELRLVVKYILELETAVVEGVDENNN